MARTLNTAFLAFFFMFAVVGYTYFGPPQYTSALSASYPFRVYIGPWLDRLLSSGNTMAIGVAQLTALEGDLSYRPSTELVFLPAREGQRLVGGTLVSAGEKSKAQITLIDNSQITLEENSTILIAQPEGDNSNGAITLKVIKGAVSAEKAADSNVSVKIVTPKGKTQMVSEQKMVVVAPKRKMDPRKSAGLLDLAAEMEGADEYMGAADKPVDEIRNELLAEQKEKIESLKQANSEQENSSTAALVMPPPSAAAGALPGAPAPAGAAPAGEAVSSLNATPPVAAPAAPPASAAPPKPATRSAVKHAAATSARDPSSIPPRVIAAKPPVASRAAAVARVAPAKPKSKWQAPPEGNDLSNAIYAAKSGQQDVAGRLMARALTRREYAGKGFSDATKFAVDGLMENYLRAKDCQQANNTVENVVSSYGDDPAATEWADRWKSILKKSCE